MGRTRRRVTSMVATAAAVAAVAGLSGCGTPAVVGLTDPVGPAVITATVDREVTLSEGADRLLGLSETGDGRLLGVIGPTPASPGALVLIDPADADASSVLAPLTVDAAYWTSAQANPQVAAGWTVAAAPRYGERAAVIAAGTRYGVLADTTAGGAGFSGVVTDVKGSPTGPVTGACVDGPDTDEAQAATWTVSGSDVIERHPFPTAVSAGRAPEVSMLVSPMISVRPEQAGVASAVGPVKPVRLGATDVVSVGGLRSLSCLDASAARALSARAPGAVAVADDAGRSTTAAALIAVVDRGLAQSWFDRGSQHDRSSPHYGEHYSMSLVGAATASGPDRLDAVVVDPLTGTVTAGVHVSGAGIPEDAQVSALTVDAEGTGAWVALAGSPVVRHVTLSARA